MSTFLKLLEEIFQKKSKEPKGKDKNDGRSKTEKFPAKVEAAKELKEEQKVRLRDKGKLFVGGLNNSTTMEQLKAYFSCFGKVVDASIVRHPDSLKSKGYGFVTFADPESAKLVLELENHHLDGRKVDVRAYGEKPRCSRPKGKNENRVFLSGVPDTMEAEDLRSFFTRYGEVTKVDVLDDKQKGIAFVSFKDKDAAEYCVGDRFVYFGGKRVHIERAAPREKSRTRGKGTNSDGVEDVGHHDDLDGNESHSSGDAASGFEEIPELLDILKNHYKFMMANPTNEIGEKVETQNLEPPSQDTREIERLLSSLLLEEKMKYSGNERDEDSASDKRSDDYDDEDDSESDSDHAEFNGKYKYSSMCNKEIPEGKFSAIRTTETIEPKIMPDPFKIKQKGSLTCGVCRWTPPDGSTESFLNHCKTPEHREKLKSRFPQDGTRETTVSEKGRGEKTKKKTRVRKRKQQNQNIQMPDFRIQALAKGMVCIQPVSRDKLRCKMCNKMIPKAAEYNNLIKNVSFHLLSRGHLAKLSEAENALKTALNKNEEGKQTKKEEKPPENNQKKKGGTATGKTGQEKTKRTAAANMLCLVCNNSFHTVEAFQKHQNAQPHRDLMKKKNPTCELSYSNNLTQCEGCERLLFGTLYDINSHISKCL